MKKLVSLVLAAFMAAAAMTSAFAATEGLDPKLNLTLYGVMDVQCSGAQIIADKMGFFTEEGLKYTCQYLPAAQDMPSVVTGKDVYVYFGSNNNDITIACMNLGLSIIGSLGNCSGTQAVMVRPDVELNTPADLTKLKIGIKQGASITLALSNLCKEAGVNWKDLEFFYLDPSEMMVAMEHKNIDVLAAWEPWISKTIAATGGNLILDGNGCYMPGYEKTNSYLGMYSTVNAKKSFIKSHPAECQALLRALDKAVNYINENKEESARICAEVLNLDYENVLVMMNKNKYDVSLSKAFKEGTDNFAQFKLELGQIRSIPKLEDYIDDSVMLSVFPEKVNN